MCYVGLYCFRQPLAILVMACLGFGDGMAPLIGYYLPFGYYPTFPFGPEDKKTISGSIGFFISSILGYFIFQHLLLLEEEEPSAELSDVLRVVALATITEGISGGYDNISVPLSVHVAIAYL